MDVIAASEAHTQTPASRRRWPVWISRFASAVFLLLYLFLHPLCYCPRYYLELSAVGLIPLVFGPRLYRFLGLAILVTGLLSSEADRRGRVRKQQQLDELRSHLTLEDEIYARGAVRHVREALQQKEPLPWKKDGQVVLTADEAIHRAVAGAAYGKAMIDKERPFRAIRSGEYWVVYGSVPQGWLGGTAVTVIRASDGRVMRIIHEQ